MQRIITNLKQICDATMRNLYKFVEGDGKKTCQFNSIEICCCYLGLVQGQTGRQNTWLYSQIQLALREPQKNSINSALLNLFCIAFLGN